MRQWFAGALLLATLLALFPALPHSSDRAPKPPISVQVVRVIDGDTIEVCCIGGKKGGRFFGKEAAEANRKLVAGKTVRR